MEGVFVWPRLMILPFVHCIDCPQRLNEDQPSDFAGGRAFPSGVAVAGAEDQHDWRRFEYSGASIQGSFAHLFTDEKFRCLTYSHMGIYILFMPRAASNSDAFNAVAEPRRREILEYLAGGERAVGDVVVRLRMEQPSVSKHLKVLRKVGLVRVRRHGRQMLYQANAEGIRPLYEWTKTFEHLWAHQLLRIKQRAEQKTRDSEKS